MWWCRGLAVPARCSARWTRWARPVKAVRTTGDSAAVRQPGLPARQGIAIRHRAARHTAAERVLAGWVAVSSNVERVRAGCIVVRSNAERVRDRRIARRPAVDQARARHATVKAAICLGRDGHFRDRAAVGHARAEVRGELAWRAYRHAPGLTGPLLVRLMGFMGFMGRRLAGASQRLAVVVVLDRYRFAWPCRFVLFLKGGRLIAVIESVGMASGRAVRVTAEAGVATFHQIPPGP
jgi:hypothetical protein